MVMPPCLWKNDVFSRLLCSVEKAVGFFPTDLSVQLLLKQNFQLSLDFSSTLKRVPYTAA